MPARAIGSATVSFGMVSIPIKLYTATESSAGISFNWLHKKCGSRMKQQYFCPQDSEVVTRDEMVKGYEFAKDRYVTFTPDELKAIEEEATQTIEITEFVPIEKVDPIYYDRPYYLGPDKGGDKAYRLLARAMQETGRAALGRYAARGKQYLVMLRPIGDRLVMQQLLYADEIRSRDEVPAPEGDVKDAELRLAVQLIGQISAEEFRPQDYKDEVRTRVRDLIQKKVEGEEISAAPPQAKQGAQIIDLMQALKASLGAKRATRERNETSGEPKAVAFAADQKRKPARRASRAVSTRKVGREKKSSGA